MKIAIFANNSHTTHKMKKLLLFLMFFVSMPLFAQNKTKVACIGNSVTFGYGHSNPSATSYPTRLGMMLGDGFDVRNFGHSGATLLRRGHRPYTKQDAYRAALDFAPDMAVIHLGLNDTDPRNWPNYRDEFIPDYLSLIDTLRAVNPDVKIWICRMTPIFHGHRRFKSGTRDWFWQIQQAIDAVSQIAAVPVIDLHESLYSRPDLFADALHPDVEGAQILASTVYSAITGDYGGLSLPAIYTSGMVIQRDKPFLLHGKADAGKTVAARLGKTKRKTVAAADGKWSVCFDAPKAGGEPLTLTVECDTQKITLDDIVVGEVWLCSGQSNMAFMLKEGLDCAKYTAEASGKNIRIYDMKPRVITNHILWDSTELVRLNRLDYYIPTRWRKLTADNAPDFSAVAYHFGAMLADSLGVPVGLVCNAVGGAPIEAFIDRKTVEHHPVLVDILGNWRNSDMVQDWVRGRANYNTKNSGNPLQRHPYEPCYLYETGIAPLAGFPIKGVIWYQGESNAHNVELFEVEFPALVDSWRKVWGSDMPFHFVQLSSIARPSWSHFRDAQRRLSHSVEACGMAVCSDKGDSLDVHPRDKYPVGVRLARVALNENYGFEGVTPSGPEIRSAANKGGRLVLTFDYADGMHASDGGRLLTFEVADETGLYYPADEVKVDGNTIILKSGRVERPMRARYGWQPFTRANLVNSDGLPASTFEIKANNNK